MKRSAIPWTDWSAGDLNFITGCTPISEGCSRCYAKAIYERHGWDFDQVQTHPAKLERLSRWHLPGKRGVSGVSDAVEHYVRGWGSKPLAFVCDTGDLFHEAVPDEFIERAIRIMGLRADVDWQILTKRPERAKSFFQKHVPDPFHLTANIWFGVTAENQKRADERVPILLDIPAAVRFVSVEPMLEPVRLRPEWLRCPGGSEYGHGMNLTTVHAGGCCKRYHGLDWVICGAESGPHRRPFNVAWAEALFWQCQEAGVAFFGKQDSAPRPGHDLLLRRSPDTRGAWPVQQFPEVR